MNCWLKEVKCGSKGRTMIKCIEENIFESTIRL